MEMDNMAYVLNTLGEKIKKLEEDLKYALIRAEVAEGENAKLKQMLVEHSAKHITAAN